MIQMTEFDLDSDGKIDLNNVYERPDPRAYYQTLSRLDYQIPSAAEPMFRKTIDALRRSRRKRTVTLLDVGSSYGVNAAILKHRFSLAGLFDLYGADATAGVKSTDALLTRDRALFAGPRSDESLLAVGLDISSDAISYAEEAGIIDAGIAANLEERSPGDDALETLAPVDLVVSTGAIGYVDAPTFDRIVEAADRKPWIAVFALRMFSMENIAASLLEAGYRIRKLPDELFRQRRFANDEERAEVLARLDSLGIDPAGQEEEGWLLAEFFLAVPDDEDDGAMFPELVPA